MPFLWVFCVGVEMRHCLGRSTDGEGGGGGGRVCGERNITGRLQKYSCENVHSLNMYSTATYFTAGGQILRQCLPRNRMVAWQGWPTPPGDFCLFARRKISTDIYWLSDFSWSSGRGGCTRTHAPAVDLLLFLPSFSFTRG